MGALIRIWTLIKGATSQCFELFVRSFKNVVNWKETFKQFTVVEKHQRDKNKPTRNKDRLGWRRLTRIANDKLEKFRLNFSRCTNRDVAPLTKTHSKGAFIRKEALIRKDGAKSSHYGMSFSSVN